MLPLPPPRGPALGSLSSSGAGHRFYEIYDPSGGARGTMLLIHGGGWRDTPGLARMGMARVALTLRDRGWRVVNISYTPGLKAPSVAPDPRPMLRDVVAFYDQIRHVYGGPICAYGQSAGAHLAAMLALERPALACAVLDAGPTDLLTLLRETNPVGRSLIEGTFGTNPSLLARWSPARLWWHNGAGPPVFATFGGDDQVVVPQQATELRKADPLANVDVVQGASPNSSSALYWLHSFVNVVAIQQRVASLLQWLDQIVPPGSNDPGPRATDIGEACDRLPPPGRRWKLMLAGDAWQQQSVPGQRTLAATRGCSGSGASQDDGLSLWALPVPGQVLRAGSKASLVLDPGHVMKKLSVTFRGFLARPQDWSLGLYASPETSGSITTPIATCNAGSCSGLGLLATSDGSLITPSGSSENPDTSDQPPSASFSLPPGTRRIAWVLTCVASTGCSLNGIAKPGGVSPRPRDPLGHPAIFSLYSVKTS